MKASQSHNQTQNAAGHRLSEFRKGTLHLSQDKLANLVGVTLRTIQRYESGQSTPPEGFYSKLSVLSPEINVNWLKTGESALFNSDSEATIPVKDDEQFYNKLSTTNCSEALEIALSEIRMLKATLAYKDNLIKNLTNQSLKL